MDEIVKTINEISQSVLKKELYQWKDQLDSSMDFSWVPKSLISSLKAAGFDPNEVQTDSRKLSTALLLLTLLFDEARMNCARAIDEGNLMKTIIELLSISKSIIDAKGEEPSASIPKWVSSALLLTDLYQKISTADARRRGLDALTREKKVVWKWFDDRQAKWQSYTEINQSAIAAAFNKGEQIVRLTASRRKYTIYLSKMIQVNDESHNRRPIMRYFEDQSAKNKNNEEGVLDDDLPHIVDNNGSLSNDQTEHLLHCCVSLCNLESIDPDTLHSCLRIILRLTRSHTFALYFAEVGGIYMLLKLKAEQGFNGFYSLASLLIRHVLESPDVLKSTIEKTVKAIGTNGASHHGSGVVQNSTGSKEINYVLRCFGPVACRNPDMFIEAVKSCLKIQLPYVGDDRDAANGEKKTLEGTLPQIVYSVKDVSNKQAAPLHSEIKKCIIFLVNTLYNFKQLQLSNLTKSKLPTNSNDKMDVAESALFTNQKTNSNLPLSSGGVRAQPAQPILAKKKQPLISQSILLRILAEIVSSYPQCASCITLYTMENGDTTLQYVMDNLLLNFETGKVF